MTEDTNIVVDTPVVDTPIENVVVYDNSNVVSTKIVSDGEGNEKLMVNFYDGTIINYNL